MTSGLLFEFQHITCMNTGLIIFGQECECFTDTDYSDAFNHLYVSNAFSFLAITPLITPLQPYVTNRK